MFKKITKIKKIIQLVIINKMCYRPSKPLMQLTGMYNHRLKRLSPCPAEMKDILWSMPS